MNVFLTGAPVAVTAYTGIAASHILGRTPHSFAGFVPGRSLLESGEWTVVK